MLRGLLRMLLGLSGALCVSLGGLLTALAGLPGVRALAELRNRLELQLGAAGGPHAVDQLRGILAQPLIGGGILLAGLVLGLLALRLGRGGTAAAVAEAPVQPGRPAPVPVNAKVAKKQERDAAALVKQGQFAAAAELYAEAGSFDKAADLFVRAEQFVRAAEVRQDQNRFLEAAELYEKAGRFEAAGTLLAAHGESARAAESYLKAGRLTVAAELFEKCGEFAKAGDCHAKSGFQRYAARAYVKSQQWEKAARALDEVVSEEGARTGTGQDPRKQKELRTLVMQAGKLWEQAGNLERAEQVLERGGCLVPAAEIAVRRERWAKAAELFVSAREPLRAADALRRIGQDQEAARLLGEYHRDRGEDEEAARNLEQAGDFLSAGDHYRKLERYGEAAACYERQGELAQAAEMSRMGGDARRAAELFERAGRFADAAECWGTASEPQKQAAALVKAGRPLEAGELYHREGLDDDALKVLQQVDPAHPGFTRSCLLLGEIFRSKGMLRLSIKKFQQATAGAELGRETLPAYFALACVHEDNGELREAVDLYEKILSFDYHFGDVESRLAAARRKLEEAGPATADAAAGRATPAPGQPGRYQTLGELGRGGMGIVYKAKDTVLDRVVAYKVLPDTLKENPQALRNFLREAKSAAQLNHPGIVTVYDAGEQDGRYYIAMEYVDGTTLKEIVRRKGKIPAKGVLHVLIQMCEALAYAHDKKIVHRDIKTANTMWTRDRKAKIMDFGLAKVMEEVRNHTTLVSGTPYYMSPEQTLGRNVDHRTDLYSLGVTVFELATGVLPFREGNVPYHHVHTPAPDPRSIEPTLPEPLAAIISRCLQKDPDARYGSAREILVEVRTAFSPRGASSGG